MQSFRAGPRRRRPPRGCRSDHQWVIALAPNAAAAQAKVCWANFSRYWTTAACLACIRNTTALPTGEGFPPASASRSASDGPGSAPVSISASMGCPHPWCAILYPRNRHRRRPKNPAHKNQNGKSPDPRGLYLGLSYDRHFAPPEAAAERRPGWSISSCRPSAADPTSRMSVWKQDGKARPMADKRLAHWPTLADNPAPLRSFSL